MVENGEAKSWVFWLKGDVEVSAQPVQNEQTVFLLWDEEERERATALEVELPLSLGDVATVVFRSMGATDSPEPSSAE